MKTEKPDWLKLKELHDAEEMSFGEPHHKLTRPRSRGVTYGPSESKVDQVGDGLIDVNHIMARFEKTGKLEELIAAGIAQPGGGMYGDFTNAPDFEKALQISIKAKEQFALLSAPVRNRFNGNPADFLAFVTDPTNEEECVRMGLKIKKLVPEPEVTLKDVRDELRATAKPKKTAGEGGKASEE